MKIDLPLYPVLNEELLELIDVNLENIEFKFHKKIKVKNRETISIEKIEVEDNLSSVIEINGPSVTWDVAYDNLIINQKLYIKNPKLLFGDYGLAESGAKIGIGFVWYSRESKQRGAKHISSFSSNDSVISEAFEVSFEPGQLRGNLHYEIILFIDEIDESRSSYLANEYGTVLGNIYSVELVLEGNSSSFPIVSIEDDNQPLWTLYCNWGDLSDLFEDSVRLRLNFNHKDYALLNVESKKYNDEFFKQIMINVVAIIIQTAFDKNEIELVEETEYFQPGTMGSLIKYYLETHQVKYDTPTDIFSSVMRSIWR